MAVEVFDTVVHHSVLRGECVRCGYRDEWATWPLGAIDRAVLEKARVTCMTRVRVQ